MLAVFISKINKMNLMQSELFKVKREVKLITVGEDTMLKMFT
jgi:hypothetical protein